MKLKMWALLALLILPLATNCAARIVNESDDEIEKIGPLTEQAAICSALESIFNENNIDKLNELVKIDNFSIIEATHNEIPLIALAKNNASILHLFLERANKEIGEEPDQTKKLKKKLKLIEICLSNDLEDEFFIFGTQIDDPLHFFYNNSELLNKSILKRKKENLKKFAEIEKMQNGFFSRYLLEYRALNWTENSLIPLFVCLSNKKINSTQPFFEPIKYIGAKAASKNNNRVLLVLYLPHVWLLTKCGLPLPLSLATIYIYFFSRVKPVIDKLFGGDISKIPAYASASDYVNYKDEFGMTAQMWAVVSNNLDFFRLLSQICVKTNITQDLTVQNICGETPIQLAIKHNREKMLPILKKHIMRLLDAVKTTTNIHSTDVNFLIGEYLFGINPIILVPKTDNNKQNK